MSSARLSRLYSVQDRLTCGREGTRDEDDEQKCNCHCREVPASRLPSEVDSEERNFVIAVETVSYMKHGALAS